jgi:hypothetical protein
VNAGLVADAILFSGSVLLLIGVWWPQTLAALGDLTPYLVLAGLAGVGVTAGAAFRGGKTSVAGPEVERLTNILSDARVIELVKQLDDDRRNSQTTNDV